MCLDSDSRDELGPPAASQPRSHEYTSLVSPTPIRYASTITTKQIRAVKAKIPGYYDDLGDGEKSIEQKLLDLFRKARAQDSHSYALVKALCREAHSIARERRTFGQRFVLSKWTESADATPNPVLTDPPEVWVAYLKKHPHTRPRGVRRLSGGKLCFNDVVASRIYAQLRPRSNGKELASQFLHCTLAVFTNVGRYERRVEEQQLLIAAHKDYCSFDVESRVGDALLTVEEVAEHYAKCGVTFDDARFCLQPWAAQHEIE